MSLNKIMLIGNVGNAPDVKTFNDGGSVANVSLATTDKGYTAQNGTQVPEQTQWHRLVFRGKMADTVRQYVHKGDKLFVEGKVVYRAYDNNGTKTYVTEVLVQSMEMLTPKQATQPQPQPQQAYNQPQSPYNPPF